MTLQSFLAQATVALKARDVGAAEEAYRRHAPALTGVADRSLDTAAQVAAILYDLGIDLGDEWRLDAAEEVFRRAITLYGEVGDRAMEAAARNRLGILRLEDGWLEGARGCFERALALRSEMLAGRDGPDNAVYRGGVLCNMANTAAAAFDFPAASALYARAESALVDAIASGADRRTAERFLASTRGGAERSAGRPSTPLEGMFAGSTRGARPQARGAGRWIDDLVAGPDPAATARQIAAAEPGTLRAHMMRGLLAGGFLAGDPWPELDEAASGEAVDAFDAAIELAPDDVGARVLKARALAHWAAACQARWRALVQATTLRLGADEGQKLLDPLLRRFRGSWQRARESYQQALRVAPNRASVWLEVGCFLREMTSHAEAEAVAAFRRALSLDPGLQLARAELARPVGEGEIRRA
jgi:tetratricopeptide (TPR) repeat protein